jgi:hypothetical protein
VPLIPEDLWELAAKMDVASSTARRFLPASVTLPAGRVISGQTPGAQASPSPSTAFATSSRSGSAASPRPCCPPAMLRYGRADVLTAKAVFEVETLAKCAPGAVNVACNGWLPLARETRGSHPRPPWRRIRPADPGRAGSRSSR